MVEPFHKIFSLICSVFSVQSIEVILKGFKVSGSGNLYLISSAIIFVIGIFLYVFGDTYRDFSILGIFFLLALQLSFKIFFFNYEAYTAFLPANIANFINEYLKESKVNFTYYLILCFILSTIATFLIIFLLKWIGILVSGMATYVLFSNNFAKYLFSLISVENIYLEYFFYGLMFIAVLVAVQTLITFILIFLFAIFGTSLIYSGSDGILDYFNQREVLAEIFQLERVGLSFTIFLLICVFGSVILQSLIKSKK